MLWINFSSWIWISGKLNFICGSLDDLIPIEDRLVIEKRFKKLDPLEERFIYVEVKGADHGFMCEERESFHKDASLIGWNVLMKELNSKNSWEWFWWVFALII